MHLLLRGEGGERRRGRALRALPIPHLLTDPKAHRRCSDGDAARLDHAAHQQGEGLLDVHAVAGTGLHEAAAVGARPLEAGLRGHLALGLQIALVAGHDLDGPDVWRGRLRVVVAGAGIARVGSGLEARVGLHVDEVVEVGELVQRGRAGDVVDEQEGVGVQVRGRPHAAILLLAGGVGDGEMVRLAIDAARHRVRVLDSRVVLRRPLTAHKSERDGGLSAAPITADGDGDAVLLVHGMRAGEVR